MSFSWTLSLCSQQYPRMLLLFWRAPGSIFPQNLPVAFLSQLVTVLSCWLRSGAHFDLLFLSHSNSIGQCPSALLVQCQRTTYLPALLQRLGLCCCCLSPGSLQSTSCCAICFSLRVCSSFSVCNVVLWKSKSRLLPPIPLWIPESLVILKVKHVLASVPSVSCSCVDTISTFQYHSPHTHLFPRTSVLQPSKGPLKLMCHTDLKVLIYVWGPAQVPPFSLSFTWIWLWGLYCLILWC